MESVCTPLFAKSADACSWKTPDHSRPKFEFDNFCSEKRKHFYCILNEFRKNNTDENRQRMIETRNEYKYTIRKFNFELDRQKSMKLISATFKNAKDIGNY